MKVNVEIKTHSGYCSVRLFEMRLDENIWHQPYFSETSQGSFSVLTPPCSKLGGPHS